MRIWRRGGRPVWAPALLWPVPLVAGILMLVQWNWGSTAIGEGTWAILVGAVGPAHWFDPWWQGLLGLLLLLAGGAALAVFFWRPPESALGVAFFPILLWGAVLFSLVALLSSFHLQEFLLDAVDDRVAIRFVVSKRTGIVDDLTTVAATLVAVALLVLSVGKRRSLP